MLIHLEKFTNLWGCKYKCELIFKVLNGRIYRIVYLIKLCMVNWFVCIIL